MFSRHLAFLRETVQQISDEGMDYRVRITSRGKITLSRIFNSFGSFYGNIKALRGELPYTLPDLKATDGKIVIEYLKKMSGVAFKCFGRYSIGPEGWW